MALVKLLVVVGRWYCSSVVSVQVQVQVQFGVVVWFWFCWPMELSV